MHMLTYINVCICMYIIIQIIPTIPFIKMLINIDIIFLLTSFLIIILAIFEYMLLEKIFFINIAIQISLYIFF